MDEKVKNSRSLNYPLDKVKQVWLTDGSDDGIPDILRKYDGVDVYQEDARVGKIGVMNRGMKFVKSPIVNVFKYVFFVHGAQIRLGYC